MDNSKLFDDFVKCVFLINVSKYKYPESLEYSNDRDFNKVKDVIAISNFRKNKCVITIHSENETAEELKVKLNQFNKEVYKLSKK